MEIIRTIDDKRPIVAIFVSQEQEVYRVIPPGQKCERWDQCHKIVPYEENGHMAGITWLAIIRDGAIDARVNANACSISYRDSL